MVAHFGLLWAMLLAGALVSGVGAPTGAGPVAQAPTVIAPSAEQGENSGTEAPQGVPVLIAAGDIGDCRSPGDEETAALIRDLPGTIATLGDNAYRSGSAEDFAACYDPTWGTEKDRTRPAAGNHDYGTRGAAGYFDYFGEAAGTRGEGFYSYDLGTWHIVVLNSNCKEIGGCERDSPQGRWLHSDLEAHPATCTLAYWHHPLFSSGTEHGGNEAMQPFWQLLYDAGADVVLSGHEHNYERFAPQDPQGAADGERGIRAFIVGTGGASHYPFGAPLPTSEVRIADTYGVLVLTLHANGYDWEFVPVVSRLDQNDERSFSDSGSADCH
jgi:acid phosphatase type 7